MSITDAFHPHYERFVPSPVGQDVMPPPTWVWPVLAMAVIVGFALQVAVRDWSREQRAALLILPPALTCFLLTFAGGVASILMANWPANRLAIVFAITKGYRLYYGPDSGPILPSFYGPITPFVYLPATLAARPTPALLIAGSINAVLFFAPLPWLVSRLPRHGRRAWLWLLACATACALAFMNHIFSIFEIHADGPAQCFALLACIPLIHRRPENTATDFFLSGLFVTLSIWAKQTAAPLAAALPLFVLLSEGWSACRAYLARLIPIALAVSLVLVLTFGRDEMLFSLVRVSAGHDWDPPGLSGFLSATIEMYRLVWFYLAALALLCFMQRDALPKTRSEVRPWLRAHPWILFVLAALVITPTCVVSRILVGGFPNSYYSDYFVVIGAVVGWTEMILTSARPMVRRLGCAFLLMVMMSGMYLRHDLWKWLPLLQNPEANFHEIDYRLAKQYPGQLYFPWDVLATLLAEDRAYHFVYAVYDRTIAGFAPTDTHIRAHLPVNLQAVGFFGQPDQGSVRDYLHLPDFAQVMLSEDYPGFVLYMR